ncbi:MAG: hypothetical protein LBK57_08065 [Clostridiales Family XIII bacterium]|jgi:uncharacterized Zn finger protein (UPF0148 family)|nr:hypothetical protein [Clostridiales Family XIII bacterium]
MIYICENCHFVFERTGEILYCPDCGKLDIRETSEEEQAAYVETRTESVTAQGRNPDGSFKE